MSKFKSFHHHSTISLLSADAQRHAQACGESTRSCMAERGSSFISGPSNASPPFGRSGSLACIESGTSSGVTCLVSSGFGGARKLFDLGLRGLSSFSRTESRFLRVNSSEGRAWPKPCEAATCSMDLKYCTELVQWSSCGCDT